MKKFIKFLLGLTAVAAAVGGVLYFLKNVFMKDYLDDYDDDFDNDLYDEDDEDRDYVTLKKEDSEAGENDSDESGSDEESTSTDSTAAAEEEASNIPEADELLDD